MNNNIDNKKALSCLKNALTSLRPDGPDGFEGLLAICLGELIGKTFRLAGAGTQNGIDGDSFEDGCHVTFEAKLYTGKIKPNEVKGKILDIISYNEQPNVWVLGATIEIKPQISDVVKTACDKNSIHFLKLDWPSNINVPPLSAICVFSNKSVLGFLKSNTKDKTLNILQIDNALKQIKKDQYFQLEVDRILSFLSEPTLGLPLAYDKNQEWFNSIISNEAESRLEFGQNLAVKQSDNVMRSNITKSIIEKFVISNNLNLPKTDNNEDKEKANDIITILGNEGNGKSWLFINSWIKFNNTNTLLLLFSANDFLNFKSSEDLIIRQLIKQTKDNFTEFKERRWGNVLKNWQKQHDLINQNKSLPNLMVYIDGLNEYPNSQWGNWVESINNFLFKVNGILVISSRKDYFDNNLFPKNSKLPFNRVLVPEWTIIELTEILESKDICIEKLNQKVVNALRNPRLLTIALNLFSNKEILSFNELNTSRLLFEHLKVHLIKNSKVETIDELKSHLSKVAKEILERFKSNNDDLSFDSLSEDENPLKNNLTNIFEGRYIEYLPDDSTLYRLKNDGLILALALLVVSNLKKSIRNKDNLSNSLTKIIEPIASLDLTAEVVLTAIQISSIDDKTPDEITFELIHEFLMKIQNLNDNWYEIFVFVTRNKPKLLLDMLYRISTSKLHYKNSYILVAALCDVRSDVDCWPIMMKEINLWLSHYSLKPSMRMSQNKKEADIESLKESENKKLENKINSMSEPETSFKNEFMLQNDEINTATLVRNIFQLLSGMPLAPHVEYLIAWKFGQSINPVMFSLYDEFMHLIQFNDCDWLETRSKFLDVISFLNETTTSESGKWALASILWALATEKDSLKAYKITKELTKDRDNIPGFRLKEKYCNTDPCDPYSSKPTNLFQTIDKLKELETGKLQQSFNISSDDHFFRDVKAAFSRFEPQLIVNKYQTIFANLLNLEGRSFYSRCHSLQQNNTLITSDLNNKLILKAQLLSEELLLIDGNKENVVDEDSNPVSTSLQYIIQLILPNLNGSSQLKFLMSLKTQGSGGPLLSQFDLYKTAKKHELEKAFIKEVKSNNENKIITLLLFSRHSNTDFTIKTVFIIQNLITHNNKSIKREVMNLASKYPTNFKNIIEVVASSDWNANLLNPSNDRREIFFGSRILILAEKYGYISINEIFERLPPNYMGYIASKLTKNQIKRLASLLDSTINTLISKNNIKQLHEIDNENNEHRNRPPLLDSTKARKDEKSIEIFAEHKKEDQSKPTSTWNDFNIYLETLSNNVKFLILDGLDIKTIDICMSITPDLVSNWVDAILAMEPQYLHNVRNVGFCIAERLSKKDPNQSAMLFKHLVLASSTVNQVYGIAKISQKSWSIWSCKDHHKINEFICSYLSLLTNDLELFTDVLTANIFEKIKLIERFVNDLIYTKNPVSIARAITICGLGIDSAHSTNILNKYKNTKGLIGKATKAAIYAYERNQWAEHWYQKMDMAKSKEDFWRFSVLFLKVVDARFEVWRFKYTPQTEFISTYWPNLEDAYKKRIGKYSKFREQNLFGQKKPNEYFIKSDNAF